MALFVKRFNRMMSKKNFGKRGQSLRKNLFVDKTCFNCGEVGHIIVNCPNKKKDKKMMKRRRRSSSRRRRMAKLILLNEIPMQAPMMMMTSHPRELPGSPSRRLHPSSLHHIVLWQKVVQRYYRMMNLKNFHMMIL